MYNVIGSYVRTVFEAALPNFNVISVASVAHTVLRVIYRKYVYILGYVEVNPWRCVFGETALFSFQVLLRERCTSDV